MERPELRPAAGLVLSCLAVCLISVADYLTGSEIAFSAFYLVLIGGAAWLVSAGLGYTVAVVSVVGSVAVDLLLHRYRTHPVYLFWNLSVQLVAFVGVAFVVRHLRRSFAAERLLHDNLQRAHTRLDEEMQVVGQIQRCILPATPPSLPGVQVAVHYSTSARAGGDYYDFLPLPGDCLGVLVADASGHGASAAVVMAMTRALVHVNSGAAATSDALLAAVDHQLAGNMLPQQFVTACYAVVDPGQHRVRYSLAGHPPPLFVRSDGRVEIGRQTEGIALGIRGGGIFGHADAALLPGDSVVFYTDGLIEARDAKGTMLEIEGVARVLESCAGASPAALVAALVSALEAHAGARREDDVTIVVVRTTVADGREVAPFYATVPLGG